MGTAIPKFSLASRLCMVREETGFLLKALHVPGWQLMKQLAVFVHFLRCSGLLDDWYVEGVFSLVFVLMTFLRYIGPNNSSQHNQSGLIDELLV
ncbi:uncharacterized protein TNCV_539771 [Trichonephila clavipes]|nr:uncharacterized protein TNCV_539771 [Trichonephila clavipes]